MFIIEDTIETTSHFTSSDCLQTYYDMSKGLRSKGKGQGSLMEERSNKEVEMHRVL
jgi:hypothetical protein